MSVFAQPYGLASRPLIGPFLNKALPEVGLRFDQLGSGGGFSQFAFHKRIGFDRGSGDKSVRVCGNVKAAFGRLLTIRILHRKHWCWISASMSGLG